MGDLADGSAAADPREQAWSFRRSDALGNIADVGAAAGGTIEAVAGAANCLDGADCSGIDLGGLDCNFG